MRVEHVLFSLAFGLRLASGTPLKKLPTPDTASSHRSGKPDCALQTLGFFARSSEDDSVGNYIVPRLYESDDAQGTLPLSVNGIESLVYTVDVQVGSQRFNLTLDTNKPVAVLFAKGFVASNRSCSKGDAQRHLFDPSLSESFTVTNRPVSGWRLDEYPYVGLECHQWIASGEDLGGIWARDTYQFGAVPVPLVPFILSNHTYYPLNPRWASDGILPLATASSEALKKVLSAFGGVQEVSLFLNNAKPSDSGPVSGGRITFGGKNTEDCSDKWVTQQSGDDSGWGLSLNSVTIGYHRISGVDFAYLSTSTAFLGVPSEEFRPVVKALGGTFSNDLDLYTVDCAKVDSLRQIAISLGSESPLNYVVKAKDYVAKINGKNGVQCALLIVQSDDGWVLGTQFLPKRCMHLDYAKNEIGFADP